MAVSKLIIAGTPLFIIGFLIFALSTFQLVSLPLFTGGTSQEIFRDIDSGESDTTALVETSHPLFILIKVSFTLESQDDIECDASLIYESGDDYLAFAQRSCEGERDEAKSFTISTTLGPSAASRGFTLHLRIDNEGTDAVELQSWNLTMTFTLFGSVFPLIIAIAGIALIVIGFVTSKRPSAAPRGKPVPGGWEPTLQWGGGAAATGTKPPKKRPKMAIKSTAQPKKVNKKVVKKVAGGSQSTCKFCGKQVPGSAFFCPHCYGKLR